MTLEAATASLVLEILEQAQIRTGIGGPSAAKIIAFARAAVSALRRISSGGVTTAEALAELSKLKAGLADNDAAADAALADKFSVT